MNLNSNFTFHNFIVNEDNKLAFYSSKQVAEKVNGNFNPLFIYGKYGSGKTRLLHTIGNYIKENDRKKKILFIDCNEFINDFNILQTTLD
ncbi:MAG: hypothetical protein K2G03_03520, partial [Bacilli bacterium]|nr:hypothetical protein [Bacilli bacterium]